MCLKFYYDILKNQIFNFKSNHLFYEDLTIEIINKSKIQDI